MMILNVSRVIRPDGISDYCYRCNHTDKEGTYVWVTEVPAVGVINIGVT